MSRFVTDCDFVLSCRIMGIFLATVIGQKIRYRNIEYYSEFITVVKCFASELFPQRAPSFGYAPGSSSAWGDLFLFFRI